MISLDEVHTLREAEPPLEGGTRLFGKNTVQVELWGDMLLFCALNSLSLEAVRHYKEVVLRTDDNLYHGLQLIFPEG